MNPSDVIAQRNLMPSEAPRIWIPLGILLALLFLAPALGLKGFMQALVIEILIFSLLALSLNVLVGYVGLVSFGHAAFFAIACERANSERSPHQLGLGCHHRQRPRRHLGPVRPQTRLPTHSRIVVVHRPRTIHGVHPSHLGRHHGQPR